MALKPKELNQLNVVSFQTNFTRLPNVNFFCQRVNIPAMTLGATIQTTPFSDVNFAGDKLTFEQMTMNFYVNEDLSNYLEIYDWLISLGFPDNYKQYNLKDSSLNFAANETTTSDMNLILETNKSNPNYSVVFREAFPVSLGSIELDTAATTLEPIVVDATFAYSGSFSIDKII
tara:strand:- start:3949 stop:4470 length:522 start_codon:yes stop_codon:yes gene_type:complete